MSQKWVQGELFPVKKICTKCGVEKPLDKFYFKLKRDNTRDARCSDCVSEARRKYREANREKDLERQRKYRVANREKERERCRKYREDNREKAREGCRKWYAANRDKRNALDAKRRAAKLQRTPKWLTKEHYKQMEDMYTKAQRLFEQLDVKYNVDHIIPLQGNNVSGLHVPWNLQVITAEENNRKYNKYE